MGLTEVVYKIRSDGSVLCKLTERDANLKVIVNQTSWDDTTRTVKAILNVLGPDDAVTDVRRELEKLYDDVDIVSEGRGAITAKTSASLDTLTRTGNPLAFALEYFGERALVEPALVKDGYVNTRLVVTGKVDLADMLATYEKGVKGGRWNDFKLIRIDDFDPEQQIHGAFTENLTQKQLEVIKTALALGFYNTPRSITLDDLSNIFGISKAAVHNRLQAAERKVISKFFS
jgi:predicted DNA binding protein